MTYLLLAFYISVSITSLVFLIKLFIGKTILELDSQPGAYALTIKKSGFYSIWIKGQLFKLLALHRRNVNIYDSNNSKKSAFRSIFKPKVNGVNEGSRQLKYYYLKKGEYKFQIGDAPESSLGTFDNLILKAVPSKGSTDFQYRIKNTYPEFLFPFLIAGMMLPILPIMKLILELNKL